MGKIAHFILTGTLCLAAVTAMGLFFILFIGAGFVFSDIDHSDFQQESAEAKALVLEVVSAVGFCVSLVFIPYTGKISKLILRTIGVSVSQ